MTWVSLLSCRDPPKLLDALLIVEELMIPASTDVTGDALIPYCEWTETFLRNGGTGMLMSTVRSLMSHCDGDADTQRLSPVVIACWSLLFKLLVYVITKAGVTIPGTSVQSLCPDVVTVLRVVTEDARVSTTPEAMQKAIWGSKWRSVHGNALSWGLALLRECVRMEGGGNLCEALFTPDVVEGFMTGVLCMREKQDRVGVGAGLARLVRVVFQSSVSTGTESPLPLIVIQSLLSKLKSSTLYHSPDNTAQYFRLLRAMLLTACVHTGVLAIMDDIVKSFVDAILSHPILELDDGDEDIVLQGLLNCADVAINNISDSK